MGFLVLTLNAPWPSAATQTPRRQSVASLPTPEGPFGVGRVTLLLSDSSRREPSTQDEARRLTVDVWYPADRSGGPPAPYLDLRAFADQVAASSLQRYLRTAVERVSAGEVLTHAVTAAPFARDLRRRPLLVFSHGGGEMKETYTVQLEGLASLGYIVASIAHTYDAAVTILPDGRSVLFTPRWPRTAANITAAPTDPVTQAVLAELPPAQIANPQQLRWWADDIRFVAAELARTPARSSPFAGHIDASRIGSFGHSFGGMAAATACQRDSRIRACVDEDGLFARMPYLPDATGWGMDGSFMLLVREGPSGPPPADELARMNITREEALARAAKMDERQDATLRKTGRGSYRVTLSPDGTSHSDFGDLPLLQAEAIDVALRRRAFLKVVIDYVDAFFAESLNGKTSALLRPSSRRADALVRRVERFPPAQRQGR